LSGLLPAIRATRGDLSPVLKGEIPAITVGRQRFSGRSLMVVGQLALSLAFLVATGLLAQGFLRVLRADPGFQVKELLVVNPFGIDEKDEARARQYYGELMERLRALPGIQHVSLAARVPFCIGRAAVKKRVCFPGTSKSGGRTSGEIEVNIVETNFLQTMGLRGRAFSERDDASNTRVVIISEAMARKYWPEKDPLGQTFHLNGPDGPSASVIGVAADVKQRWLGETPEPFFYLSWRQEKETGLALLVATTGNAIQSENLVRREMRAVNENIVPWNVQTLKDGIWKTMAHFWTLGSLLATLCLMAFLLAIAGLYGIVSYSVARRTPEIGIRMALGAQRSDILRLILRQGLRLSVCGVALGLLLTYASWVLLRRGLTGFPSLDPLVLTVASLLVVVVALAASFIPARRASRVDPMTVLRHG